LYRSVSPAWSDRIASPLFLAHVRAATGTPVRQTNCHPFRDGRWLFVHNGFVGDHLRVRRDLMLALEPRASSSHCR
jgi:predicted glutamine amidotransferase